MEDLRQPLALARAGTRGMRESLAFPGPRERKHDRQFATPDVEGPPAPSISVVIPTLNEAENLPHVLPKVPLSNELIIVDGGSTDDTVQVAQGLWPQARVIQQSGRGKGDALACGFAVASGDIIVMLDADGSARVEEIPRFVDVLLRGADFAKGSRFLDGGGSADISVLRRAGNWVLGTIVNILYGTKYSDLCYGYNAFWRRCLECIEVDCDGFEVETLINIRAAKAGLCVVEVPSFEDERIHGRSNLRIVRDGWRVLRTILHERFTPSPQERPARSRVPGRGVTRW